MNVNELVKRYFGGCTQTPTIEVFDRENIYNTYTDIVSLLNQSPNIELSILQGLSYCFYEILDNVLTHSEKLCGTAIMHYSADEHKIRILVADDGIGIKASLSTNPLYINISEEDALSKCIHDKVTDGKGMGFGLYSTALLIKNAGVTLDIHSGSTWMEYNGQEATVKKVPSWQGTLVYFELYSNREINPSDVVENRTDCASQFNEIFNPIDDGLLNLWSCEKTINMRTFKFNQFNENLGTRQLGAKAREQLLAMMQESDEKISLDFEGVNVVSNSFADECLAKLLLHYSLDELKKRTTFVSLNDFARLNIAVAFKRRLQQTFP
jgi:anti-sigma regulatory factor (Ser/Thr protein kinase)